jgi:hypothetical protein
MLTLLEREREREREREGGGKKREEEWINSVAFVRIVSVRFCRWTSSVCRVFNDLIDDFTKSDFKSFWDDFKIF